MKPTLSCNIRCRHCYHGHSGPDDIISMDAVEKIIRLASEEYESAWFIWHGGEPLLLPLRFYKDVMRIQEKYFGKGSFRVSNTIQTNGILADKKFMGFCRDNKINVGVSYEGPCNNVLRTGTDEVERNLEMMKKGGHMFSVGSAICRSTVNDQKKIYDHTVKKGIALSLSPVICSGSATPDMIPDADEYAEASISLFNEWLNDEDAEMPLMPHLQYVMSALGEPSASDCAHSSCLMKWLSVYPNGDVYPCGKGCPSKFRLCNIDDIERLSDAFGTDAMREMFIASIERREKCKAGCELFAYCGGGCSVDALSEGSMSDNGGASCRIFKRLFAHILGAMNAIISEERDLSRYNKFIREAVIGKLVNPRITNI
ncbi:MAG: radical SAM protein [Methanomassiliicoccaceae archaeon]|nr:radical SAM protein [Methanomassiliicoccaceae archaeon]